MEKVRIVKCDLIMNGKAHGVKLADGRDCTAWCDKVEGGILMQHLGKEISLEIKPYMSKTGKQGFNIVGIGETMDTMDHTSQGYSQGSQSEVSHTESGVSPVLPSGSPSGNRDNSIVSQVLVKSVVKLMCPILREQSTLKEIKDLGEGLLKITYELYKDGVDLLEGKHE